MINSYNPEIIITDIRLRGHSGFELIEKLNHEGFQGEIIILSGYADFGYAQRAIENRVCGYLLKPVNIDKLEKLILQAKEKLECANMPIESKGNSIEQIVGYINAHFTEDISLTVLAQKNHYEVSSFSRKFKKYTGMSYTDYVVKLRMEYAKKYLSETTRGIDDITELVGYKSVRYFRELFEKYTGVTPSVYRKECRCRNEKQN